MSKLKVAVIGAGPAGICALRRLSLHPDLFEPVGFEVKQEVGGLWNYSACTDIDEHGLPCSASMYKQLRTNLPLDVMAFQDKQHPDGLPSFAGFQEVKRYLDDYCKTFDLNKYCKFQTIVQNIRPQRETEDDKWLVTSRNLTTEATATDVFDKVIVCSGKEGTPFIPDYPGLDKFQGIAIHTKNIRDLDLYRGKTVLLIGSSFSARDMIFELGPTVHKMYVSHRREGPLPFETPENVHGVPNVKEILPTSVILENSECYEIDMIIFATGYQRSYPFLSEECGATIQEGRLKPIYNHMFNIECPSMCFMGLHHGVLEFQLMYVQAHYICAVMRGDIKLPTKLEMYRQEEEDYQKRVVAAGLPPKYTHASFALALQPYIEKLESEIGEKLIQNGTFKFWNAVLSILSQEFGTLKKRTFRIGKDDFEMTM